MSRKKHRTRKRSPPQQAHTARPFWSGTITFGLVSVPVNLFPAQRSVHTGLRMLAPDGTPLSRQYYCPQDEQEVPLEHIVRGYEVAKGEFVLIDDEELESLQPRKSHDIDLQRFVMREELPPLFFERAYFLTPAGDSTKAYRLLAEAMEREDRVGIATFVMRGKEYLVGILAEHGILRAETLRFEDEVRSPQDIGLPKPSAADADSKKQWTKSIRSMTSEELPLELMSDDYHGRLQKLVQRKQKASANVVEVKGKPKAEESDSDEEPIDLLESIRRQLSRSNGSSSREGTVANGKSGRHKNLQDKSKQDLYAQARRLKISGRSNMTKGQLISAIKKH